MTEPFEPAEHAQRNRQHRDFVSADRATRWPSEQVFKAVKRA